MFGRIRGAISNANSTMQNANLAIDNADIVVEKVENIVDGYKKQGFIEVDVKTALLSSPINIVIKLPKDE